MNTAAASTVADTDYRAIFDELPGLYLVLNPQLKIVAATKAYLQATETSENIIGNNVFDVFPDSSDNRQVGQGALRRSFERVIRDRIDDGMALQRYDIRRPDGTFEVRYWSPVNVPVLDARGKLRWIVHRVTDVTAAVLEHPLTTGPGAGRVNELETEVYRSAQRLRQANEAVRRSESRLRLAIEAGRMAVWRWRAKDEQLVITPELNILFGFPPNHPTTMEQVRVGFEPGVREAGRRASDKALAAGERYFEHEFRYTRAGDGLKRWTFTDQPPAGANPRRFLRAVFTLN